MPPQDDATIPCSAKSVPYDDTSDPPPALPTREVDHVVGLLETVGNLHPDLPAVLGARDADRVLDDIFRDELQARRS